MKAAFFCQNPNTIEKDVYGGGRCAKVAELVDLYPVVITPENIDEHLPALHDIEAIFSSWGVFVPTEEQFAAMPNLKIMFFRGPGNERIEAHEQPLGHGDGKPREVSSVYMAMRHGAPCLHEADRDARGVGRVLFEGVLRIGQERAGLVEQLLDRVQLVVDGRETRVTGLVGQLVRPAALERDMVVYLGNHEFELSRVDSVSAHGSPPWLQGRTPKAGAPFCGILHTSIR